MSKLHKLNRMGQSPWLNYMRRSFIESGELRQRMNDGIRGITANATIFQRALMASNDYDEMLQAQLAAGMPTRRIHEALMVDDVQRTADLLHPVFESSDGLDGLASLELDPALAHDTVGTVATARRMTALLDRGNVMVEIPSTAAGIAAIEALTGDGVCVNATHIFDIKTYERITQAYINGLEAYLDSHREWRIWPTAVASFSLSPIDNAVDLVLLDCGHPELLGKTAVTLAQVLYGRFRDIFSGPRWEKLARRGARVLRPKWTRTAPHSFRYADTFYVDALIGPDTVTTFSPATLNAFLDHGTVANTLSKGVDEAHIHLEKLAQIGIDLDTITTRLQKQHLIASDQRFQALTTSVSRRRDELEAGWERLSAQLGDLQEATDKTLDELKAAQMVRRLWAHDQTLWPPVLTQRTDHLGWLHVIDKVSDNAARLQAFVQDVLADDITNVLLIGPQSTCLMAELFYKTFGKPAQQPMLPFAYPTLAVADISDLDAAYSLRAQLDAAKTLFIVDAQAGCETATLAGFDYFYGQAAVVLGTERAGRHFVTVTAYDSPFANTAAQYGFRERFFTDPLINGRFAALSYSGLLPAALVGVDVNKLLERAAGMAANSESCTDRHLFSNQAAQLGAIIGTLALFERNTLTLLNSLALDSLSAWVTHLLANSIGIVPLIDEAVTTPEAYDQDRLFVHLRLAGDRTQDTAVAALVAAGHPVVTLKLQDLYDVGGQFFLWEMATAVAAHILRINPFSQHAVGMTEAYAM
jgi:transaldolase/glucose-6-phosphate isomerase